MQKGSLIIVASTVFGFSLLAHLPAQLVVPDQTGEFQFLGAGFRCPDETECTQAHGIQFCGRTDRQP